MNKWKIFLTEKTNWLILYAAALLAPISGLIVIRGYPIEDWMVFNAGLLLTLASAFVLYLTSLNASIRSKSILTIACVTLLFCCFPLAEHQARIDASKDRITCKTCGFKSLQTQDIECSVCGCELFNSSLSPIYDKETDYIKAEQIDYFCPWDRQTEIDFYGDDHEDNPNGYIKDEKWHPLVTEKEVQKACQS